MKQEKVKYLNAAILVRLHEESGENIDAPSSISYYLHKYFKDDTDSDKFYASENEIEASVSELEQKGFLYGHHDPHARSRYEITTKGQDEVVAKIANADGLIYKYYRLGPSWLFEVFDNINKVAIKSTLRELDNEPIENETELETANRNDGGLEVSQTAPASDRLVTVNHNTDEYKEAVSALDEVILSIVGDNEYGAERPEEKEGLLDALRGGQKLLDALEVSLAAVKATLLPALQYVADNFTKGVIAALATSAIAAVSKLLGLF